MAPAKRIRSEYEIEEEEPTNPYFLPSNHSYGQSISGVQQGGTEEEIGHHSVSSQFYYESTVGQQDLTIEPSILDPAIRDANQPRQDQRKPTLLPLLITALRPNDIPEAGDSSYGSKLYPNKQRLTDIVRAGMILVGDELEYTGETGIHCQILVS